MQIPVPVHVHCVHVYRYSSTGITRVPVLEYDIFIILLFLLQFIPVPGSACMLALQLIARDIGMPYNIYNMAIYIYIVNKE